MSLIDKQKDKQTIALVFIAVITVIVLLIAGAYFVGYRTADGTPDVIDLTVQQEANIVKLQERICDKAIREETRNLKDMIDDKDDLIEILQNKQDYFLNTISSLNEKYDEVKEVVLDLNQTISDLNC